MQLPRVLIYLLFVIISVTTSNSDELDIWAVRISQTTYPDRSSRHQEAERVASELGLVNSGLIEPFNDLFKFILPLSSHHGYHTRLVRDTVDTQLESHSSVVWSSKQITLKRTKRTNTLARRGAPVINFNDPKFQNQWHLHNKQERGHDINVTGIWWHNVTGRGVVVAVVDDGVEHGNSDLTANYEPLGSYDFNSDDLDPTPDLSKKVDNTHGTRCAGLIAAEANNSVCGVGVAYGGRVSGIRMLDGSVTDILEAQSFIYKAHVNHIYSCSWGPEDNGRTVEGPGPLAREALKLGTKYGRYGYGNIYVFASGNGGTVQDNCNYDGYANSVYTLTIGAVDELNRMPYYAELCAAMLAVTYSNGQRRSIVTTDGSNHHGCTMGFSGTSAAAPIAAGMVALMLEVRPCLTWRDVQAIVVYSAVKVDAQGAEWVANAAGFHHSDQHGFGLMDAYRLTVTAAVWPLLPVMAVTRVEGGGAREMPAVGQSLIQSVNVEATDIPDNLSTLEYVAMTMKVSHACRGSLEISLSSPAGTPSTLITPRQNDYSKDGFDWTFTSARFWGEGPLGKWVLNVTDNVKRCPGRERKGGIIHHWTLTFYGSSVMPEEIVKRKNVVEEAVSSGSVESSFLCPPLNHTLHNIVLPDISPSSWSLLEKIGLTIVAVIIAVIILNFALNWIFQRCKSGLRPRPSSTAVLFTNRQSRDDEETCALLMQEGGVAESEEGVVTLDEFRRVNDNFNNNSGGVEVCDPGDPGGERGTSLLDNNSGGVEVCDPGGERGTSLLDVTLPFDDSTGHIVFVQSESVEISPHEIHQSDLGTVNDSCQSDDGERDDETSTLLSSAGQTHS